MISLEVHMNIIKDTICSGTCFHLFLLAKHQPPAKLTP